MDIFLLRYKVDFYFWQVNLFITIEAHTAEEDDELSFETGVIVDVLHKHLDGWWVAR